MATRPTLRWSTTHGTGVLCIDRNPIWPWKAALPAALTLLVAVLAAWAAPSRPAIDVRQSPAAAGVVRDEPALVQEVATPPAPPVVPALRPLVPPPSRPRVGVDTSTLPARLAEHGFVEPEGGFLAYVIATRFADGRARIVQERRFDYDGTSEDASGTWNPAATVKLYVAVGALQRIRTLGFDRRAALTYHGDPERRTFTLGELVEAALGPNDNLAYDYLAVFVGFDRLHEELLVPELGFERAVLRAPFDQLQWTHLGFSASLRDSPPITVQQGNRSVELPAETGEAPVACRQGSCTTPAELGETLRRVMLQEILPAEQTFRLAEDDLALLRKSLAGEQAGGPRVVERLRPFFGPRAVLSHRAGFADDWATDNVYIDDPALDRTWVVVMAAGPGRASLNRAAELMGRLLSSGALDP